MKSTISPIRILGVHPAARATVFMVLLLPLLSFFTAPIAFASPSAGLAWGPKYAGNLKAYLTNPHPGYAGPKVGVAQHQNFHIDKRQQRRPDRYDPVVNFHITKYSRSGASCLYVWESETRSDVFDGCTDDPRKTAERAARATLDFAKTLPVHADLSALGALFAAAIVMIVSVLIRIAPAFFI